MRAPGTVAVDTDYDVSGHTTIRGLVGPELVRHLADYTAVLRDSGGLEVDDQVPGSLRRYGAPGFDALLASCAPAVSARTGRNLLPTYSFVRVYGRGQELMAHRDRPECEHSVTLHLASSEPEPWPIWLRDAGSDPVSVDLRPGDALVYRGDRLLHWRDRLDGEWFMQVFLHYVDADGPFADRRLDGRGALGMPPAR